MFRLELIFGSLSVRIAASPKLFNKPLLLLGRDQLLEHVPFFVRNDINGVFTKPLLKIVHHLFIPRPGTIILTEPGLYPVKNEKQKEQ